MSDTAPRNPTGGPRFLADALLGSVSGSSAFLRVAGRPASSAQSELGIVATSFAAVEISPVVMRRLRPSLQMDEQPGWELLVSATSIGQRLKTLDVTSAQSLFAMTLAVTVGGKDYLIESAASNEAFGETYLYRLQLREARKQAV